jgi:hypothetical protein
MALLGVELQFSRETSESNLTAMLWTISAALFLEAARTGRAWTWIGAGLAGGYSISFYPTSRLWPALAGCGGKMRCPLHWGRRARDWSSARRVVGLIPRSHPAVVSLRRVPRLAHRPGGEVISLPRRGIALPQAPGVRATAGVAVTEEPRAGRGPSMLRAASGFNADTPLRA